MEQTRIQTDQFEDSFQIYSPPSELARELWFNKLRDSKTMKDIPKSPTYYWLKGDIFCPELPDQMHINLVRLRIKSRGSQDECCVIEVGRAILVNWGSNDVQDKVYIPFEIQVKSQKFTKVANY